MSLFLVPSDGSPGDSKVMHGQLLVGQIHKQVAPFRAGSEWLWIWGAKSGGANGRRLDRDAGGGNDRADGAVQVAELGQVSRTDLDLSGTSEQRSEIWPIWSTDRHHRLVYFLV
jgi:hypothetical protein